MTDKHGLLELLATPEPPELGPGPRTGVKTEAELEEAFSELLAANNLSRDQQQLLRALVLLWHDHEDSAHQIAQAIENADGSFVHGIVHRREPDYGNAEYWFRRVGKHPAFAEIAKRVEALAASGNGTALLQTLAPKGNWDPFAFIAACGQASGSTRTKEARLLREVQRIESEVLLDYFCGH